MRRTPPRGWPGYESRLLIGACLVALPGLVFGVMFVWQRGGWLWAAWGGAVFLSLALAFALRRRVVYPLHTVSNLLEALREGDYSLRGSAARHDDAIGEVVREVNALAHTLRDQRLRMEEANALLGKIVAAIDIALFGFDPEGRLRLVNPAGEQLLGCRAVQALGRDAASLGLEALRGGQGSDIVRHRFPGAEGRFEVRRFLVREEGRPHELLVVSDLSRALREEERLAWQRLIRVLGHELNNSLAPIRSMADTLSRLAALEPPPPDFADDARQGLHVIGARAEALGRFMASYTALARLPAPRLRPVALTSLLRRVLALEQRLDVMLGEGPELRLALDPDQVEQALINLVKNAVEAALATGGGVRLDWRLHEGALWIEVRDDGLGLGGSENLFVPFFTTKPGGTGIGLVLARQIVEGHGGRLSLDDRLDAPGCVARVVLPLGAADGIVSD